MSGHGFTHRNDVPGVDGLTNHQRWAVRRIAAETPDPDYSGYVRTDCARCGPDTSNCTCPVTVFCGVAPAPARPDHSDALEAGEGD
jgi:hypothetical protein